MVTHVNNYISFAAYQCNRVLANEINEQEMHRMSSVYEGSPFLLPPDTWKANMMAEVPQPWN